LGLAGQLIDKMMAGRVPAKDKPQLRPNDRYSRQEGGDSWRVA